MYINLSDVLSEQHKTVDETVDLTMDSIRNASGTFTITDKQPVHVVVSHIKDKEFRIHLDTKITFCIPCDRCLKEVNQEIDLHADKLVDLSKSEAELTEDFDDAYFIKGHQLDVEELLLGELLIAWPAKVLCDEDCTGICSICGKPKDVCTCDLVEVEGDPRMTLIRDLFQKNKEV